jgi:ECF transporter S component (folate family)
VQNGREVAVLTKYLQRLRFNRRIPLIMLLTRNFPVIYIVSVYNNRRIFMKNIFRKYLTFQFDVRTLACEGMLLAACVVLDFFSIEIGTSLKFNLLFFPVAISGALFGPLWTCLMGVAGDLIVCIIKGNAPFWELTVVAGAQGLLYGALLFEKTGIKLSIFSVLAKLFDTIVLSLLINTHILISYGYASGTSAGWAARISKAAIEFPVYAIFLALLMPKVIEIYGKIASKRKIIK